MPRLPVQQFPIHMADTKEALIKTLATPAKAEYNGEDVTSDYPQEVIELSKKALKALSVYNTRYVGYVTEEDEYFPVRKIWRINFNTGQSSIIGDSSDVKNFSAINDKRYIPAEDATGWDYSIPGYTYHSAVLTEAIASGNFLFQFNPILPVAQTRYLHPMSLRATIMFRTVNPINGNPIDQVNAALASQGFPHRYYYDHITKTVRDRLGAKYIVDVQYVGQSTDGYVTMMLKYGLEKLVKDQYLGNILPQQFSDPKVNTKIITRRKLETINLPQGKLDRLYGIFGLGSNKETRLIEETVEVDTLTGKTIRVLSRRLVEY